MGLPGAPALLLGALALILGDCEGGSSHSFHALFTTVSETGHGLPYFSGVVYVDNQVYCSYDSNTRQLQPRAPWMKKVVQEDPQFVKWNTKTLQENEPLFREYLMTAMNRYNQSRGFHSMQWMYSCELREDGSKRGYIRDAYDGRDYLSFDLQTLTWTAADPKAQITKEKWEKDPAIAQRQKAYLEGICTEWLQRYLEYGKDSLLRRDRPVGKVTRKEGYDDRETLVCQAYGFYPKEIDVTWRKDGEVRQEGTFHRSVAPYPDGTYHAWLSIEIDPKERDWYQCHVDHASLGEPLILAWEAPGKLQDGCRTALINDRGMNSCGREIVYLGCPLLCIKGLRTVGKEWLVRRSSPH
uniref:Class I histocompatibility antigen, F10 alpha chain-like isoform X1 n=1 Tax=Pogona vitticeps TaxID=103695 RepID=A0ABM5FF29_9SAUR